MRGEVLDWGMREEEREDWVLEMEFCIIALGLDDGCLVGWLAISKRG